LLYKTLYNVAKNYSSPILHNPATKELINQIFKQQDMYRMGGAILNELTLLFIIIHYSQGRIAIEDMIYYYNIK